MAVRRWPCLALAALLLLGVPFILLLRLTPTTVPTLNVRSAAPAPFVDEEALLACTSLPWQPSAASCAACVPLFPEPHSGRCRAPLGCAEIARDVVERRPFSVGGAVKSLQRYVLIHFPMREKERERDLHEESLLLPFLPKLQAWRESKIYKERKSMCVCVNV